ncbi:MAG: thiamine pyrophosphate-dependent enzyme [Thermoplasmata archaeon]|nr:thiamine pyrophosphate-dependent enzyme [Thermoplasmata archaeon]MCI4354461.1 thiamine pyrophosphate-dependent enzyme [Thermoplasmata archaeon]
MAKLTLPVVELMRPGHAACPGCAPALAMRLLLKGLGPRTILSIPACCWTVIATPYPTTALGVAVLDTPIESTGASISGLRAAADALGLDDVQIVGFAGDGGTADIGLQSLSGMLERRTDAIYVMYDNEAYMNTGVQRSGATPLGAATTTTPVSATARGKAEPKKDIMAIVLAHRPVYAATVSPSFPEDFVRKVERARGLHGPRFFHVLAPCPPGWRYSPEQTIAVGRLATDTGVFPLYEVEEGRLRITRRLSSLKPVREYLKAQGRFSHLTDAEIAGVQLQVRAEWERLLALDAATVAGPRLPTGPA